MFQLWRRTRLATDALELLHRRVIVAVLLAWVPLLLLSIAEGHTQSVFFSPKAPTAGGLIWGAGPVFLLPTGSESQLSARKWGIGPTGSTRPDVSSTFIQPFLSYTTKDAWTFGLNTESSYDWKAKQWAVPINLTVSKLVKFGSQPVSIGGGLRYWAQAPDGGPHDMGLRLTMSFPFPK